MIEPDPFSSFFDDPPQELIELLEWNSIVHAELVQLARGVSAQVIPHAS